MVQPTLLDDGKVFKDEVVLSEEPIEIRKCQHFYIVEHSNSLFHVSNEIFRSRSQPNRFIVTFISLDDTDKGVLKMRRNKIVIYMLVLFGLILLGGCTVTVEREPKTVEEALVGHWVNTMGSPDYYFTATELIEMDDEGTKIEMTYVVVESNEDDNTITIQTTDSKGGEEDKKIEFSEDRETMKETSYILGVESGTEDFTYVDSKTKP